MTDTMDALVDEHPVDAAVTKPVEEAKSVDEPLPPIIDDEKVNDSEGEDAVIDMVAPSIDPALEVAAIAPALVSVHHALLQELAAAVSEQLPPVNLVSTPREAETEQEMPHTPRLTALTFVTPSQSERPTPRSPVVDATDTVVPAATNGEEFSLPLDGAHFIMSSEPLLFLKITATLSSLSCSHALKAQALQAAIDLVRRARNVTPLIEHGVYDEAVINAGEGNETVRILATHVLLLVVTSHNGRQHANTLSLLNRCPQWLIDQVPDVRSNSALIVNQLTSHATLSVSALYRPPQSTAAANCPSLLAFLIYRLSIDTDYVTKSNLLLIILRAIKTKEGRIVARYQRLFAILRANFTTLSDRATSPFDDRNSVARNKSLLTRNLCLTVAELVLDPTDKRDFVNESFHSVLIPLMTHSDSNVRLAAVLAMMNGSVDLTIKLLSIQSGIIDAIIVSIDNEDDSVILATVLQLLCNVCEHPQARQYGGGKIYSEDVIRAIQRRASERSRASDKHVHSSARAAVDKLRWKP